MLILYVLANDATQQREWVDILRGSKMLYVSKQRVLYYLKTFTIKWCLGLLLSISICICYSSSHH